MAKRRKVTGAGSRRGGQHHPASSSSSNGKRKPQKPTAKTVSTKGQHKTQQKQHTEATIPFSPQDRILLVGEGDLSFAASLVTSHYCASLTATVFEKSRDEVLAKYPHATANIDAIEAEDGCRVLYNIDATTMKPLIAENKKKQQKDSTKPGSTGTMDRILFNFPHIGGKSTDVNRQVRHNQELLVSFFQRAEPFLRPGGSIIVTLFEREPYTLWNVRDLARHSGLRVSRSFKFRADAYPGYHHARTLGVVRRGGVRGGGGGAAKKAATNDDEAHAEDDDEEEKGERQEDEEDEDQDENDDEQEEEEQGPVASTTAWKGEDRAARSYVFVRKDEEERIRAIDEVDEDKEDDDKGGFHRHQPHKQQQQQKQQKQQQPKRPRKTSTAAAGGKRPHESDSDSDN